MHLDTEELGRRCRRGLGVDGHDRRHMSGIGRLEEKLLNRRTPPVDEAIHPSPRRKRIHVPCVRLVLEMKTHLIVRLDVLRETIEASADQGPEGEQAILHLVKPIVLGGKLVGIEGANRFMQARK